MLRLNATEGNKCSSDGLPRGSRGFSLVEISLALMVVGVGMLAILGMFPAGLDQNARSISDTHAAMFAQEVFGALRVNAETNWQEIGNNIIYLPAAASNNWHKNYEIGVWLDNIVGTNIYRHPVNPEIIDHAFRYRITLTTNGMIKSAFLRFWAGEFGQTSSPTVFYSEFFRSSQ
jgi:prepilin-type N-terminal cleavage/methylation domain-containing protein